jgi:hypothetical protein
VSCGKGSIAALLVPDTTAVGSGRASPLLQVLPSTFFSYCNSRTSIEEYYLNQMFIYLMFITVPFVVVLI